METPQDVAVESSAKSSSLPLSLQRSRRTCKCVSSGESTPLCEPRTHNNQRSPAGLLLLLPSELQLEILVLLDPSAIISYGMSCCSARALGTKIGHAVWSRQLARRLGKVPSLDAASGLDSKRLFFLLYGPDGRARSFEARGLCAPDASKGEMSSWWRCTIVGIAFSGRGLVRARVRYLGYPTDDEDVRCATDTHLRMCMQVLAHTHATR